jgi:Mitochondrial ribosomal protein S25
MNEVKTPTQRYQEIHGFDESQARGRPQQRLPQYGNIQEVNKDVDKILQTWREITTELDRSLQHRQALRDEVARLSEQSSSLTEESTATIAALRQQIKETGVLIHRLQKKVQKMSKMTPQVAYLQACSEFYLLRQREEVEIRIATEQARMFKLEMAQSVNEREISKEQEVLQEWKYQAEREHAIQFAGRNKGRDPQKAEAEAPEAIQSPNIVSEEILEPVDEEEELLDVKEDPEV